MQKVLFKDFDVDDALEIAFKDWERDTNGAKRMPKQTFVDSMFELADLWTDSIDGSKYVAFLSKLLTAISESYKIENAANQSAEEGCEDAASPRSRTSDASEGKKYDTDGSYVSKRGVSHPRDSVVVKEATTARIRQTHRKMTPS